VYFLEVQSFMFARL